MLNVIDKALAYLSPRLGRRRLQERLAYRMTLQNFKDAATSGGQFGYDAGKSNRYTFYGTGREGTENDVPVRQSDRLRWFSWQLYRNNPHARKIVRNLESKVIGRSMMPQSAATRDDGAPHEEFRERAEALWLEVIKAPDVRGRPGRGGLSFAGMQQCILRQTVLSGETLYRFVFLSAEEQQARGLPLPLQVQLVHAHRLDDSLDDLETFFRGIEFNARGERLAYHVAQPAANARFLSQDTVRVSAAEMGHLFVAEDVDQHRGSPWFGATLLRMRAQDDYELAEIDAAGAAACVALAYRPGVGQAPLGLTTPKELSDPAGNPITALQRRMIINLGDGGEIHSFNPTRPSNSATEFLTHLMRAEAAGVAGTKSSTVTGDYRESSFSSEASADNDIWPEVYALQEWVAAGFLQPVWEQVLDIGVRTGAFAGIVTGQEYARNKRLYACANWQGPVRPSINQKDDAEAARQRVKNGQSTPQIEALSSGKDPEEIRRGIKAFIESWRKDGIPDVVIMQALGIENANPGATPETGEAKGPRLAGAAA